MKKIIFAVVLMFFLFLTYFSAQPKEFTFMIYMIGSDLESDGGSASNDIEEILNSEYGDYNVVIQTGGTLEWFTEGFEDVQRWYVEDNELVWLEDLGKVDMGLERTLSDFIGFAFENFPAERNVLVFWNHGSGPIYGFGGDELFDGSMLSLKEITSALSDFDNGSFELIGFDACLMGSAEIAYSLRDFAKYLIASEELEPEFGWDYTSVLNPVAENPSIKTEDLAYSIARSYIDNAKVNDEEETTISVIDLKQMRNVVESLDDFLSDIQGDFLTEKGLKKFGESRKNSESFGKMAVGESSDLVDIIDLVKKLGISHSSAQKLINSVEKAVLYNFTGDLKKKSTGLSVYLPERNTAEITEQIMETYYDLEFSEEYKEFIKEYLSKLSGLPSLDQFMADSYVEGSDDYFDFIIDPESFDYISEIEYSIGIILEWDEGGEFVLWLGSEDDYEIDYENGFVTSEYWMSWEMLGDYPVPMYPMDKNDDYSLYAIPALLNGEEVNIFLLYDDNNEDPRILGARNFTDENTGLFDRGYTAIKSGDIITPIYEYYDYETDESDYTTLYDYEVSLPLKVEMDDLPEGDYVYAYRITDLSGNVYYSDTVEMEIY